MNQEENADDASGGFGGWHVDLLSIYRQLRQWAAIGSRESANTRCMCQYPLHLRYRRVLSVALAASWRITNERHSPSWRSRGWRLESRRQEVSAEFTTLNPKRVDSSEER